MCHQVTLWKKIHVYFHLKYFCEKASCLTYKFQNINTVRVLSVLSSAKSSHPLPIEVKPESTLSKIGFHSNSTIPKASRRVETPRDAPERHAQEIPVLCKEAGSPDDPAAYNVTRAELWPVVLPFVVTPFLAIESTVPIRVFHLARHSESHAFSRPSFEVVLYRNSPVQAGTCWRKAYACITPGHNQQLEVVSL